MTVLSINIYVSFPRNRSRQTGSWSVRSKMVVTINCSSSKHSSEKDLLQDLPLYTFVNLYFSGDIDRGILNAPWNLGEGGGRWKPLSAL